MATTVREKRTYTVEQFMRMPDNGKRYELLEGELVEMPGPNVLHGRITRRLFHSLNIFLEANPLGEAMNELAFELGPKTAPLPDLAFVRSERLTAIDESGAFPGAPDLAIEVMSPTDKWSAVSKKVQLYQQAKTRLVWVIDPFDKGVTVYRLDRPRRLLLIDDELDGEDVIPGFKLNVRSLFE